MIATKTPQTVMIRASEFFGSVELSCIDPADPYLRAYPSLLRFLSSKPVLTGDDFICAAHMAYGWMPKILSLGDANPDDLASVISRARSTGKLSDEELSALRAATNNRLVGASKLLHFAAPNSFAIWDSWTHLFVFKKKPQGDQMKDIGRYRTYMETLRELERSPDFPEFHAAINRRIGYDVSGLRALELVMFQLARTGASL